jgi:hypothetical protein
MPIRSHACVALLSAVGILFVTGCGSLTDADSSGEADFTNAPGTINTLDDLNSGVYQYVLYPESEPGTRYCLEESELSDDLKQKRMEVIFTGSREEIPENVRLACLPLDLSEIKEAK